MNPIDIPSLVEEILEEIEWIEELTEDNPLTNMLECDIGEYE